MFEETKVARAIVRVRTRQGQSAGTGFFILPNAILTCWHVAFDERGGERELEVEFYDGMIGAVSVSRAESVPEQDIAVLRLGDAAESPHFLACGQVCQPGEVVWTAGYQQPIRVARKGFPTTATVGGHVDLTLAGRPKPFSVFTLHDASIDRGLSGAPVVDLKTGAAMGIVEYKFGDLSSSSVSGFAIPIFPAAPALQSLLAENGRAAPCYGRHMNAAGVRTLCREQMELVLPEITGSMADGRIYDPDRYVRRRYEQTIEDFLNGDEPLLPVVGHTGVGKTNLLAQVAKDWSARDVPVVFLRALHFDPNSEGLDADLERLWKHNRADDFPGLNACLAATPRLAVLLDGLNESPFFNFGRAEAWIDRSLAWVQTHRAKLKVVITSRPEFWRAVIDHVPKRLCYSRVDAEQAERERQSSDPRHGVTLGDFQEQELAQALRAYGLADVHFGAAFEAHPFFLRVCAELLAESESSPRTFPLTIYQALERYTERLCSKVSIATDNRFAPEDVRDALQKLGAIAREQAANRLSSKAVDQCFQSSDPDRLLRRRLVDCHLLERLGEGFRFGFDTLAEFFMSLRMGPAELEESGPEWLLGDDLMSGAALLAIVKQEPEQSSLVTSILLGLVATATTPVKGDTRFNPDGRFAADKRFATAIRLLTELRAPDPYIELVAGSIEQSDLDTRYCVFTVEQIFHLATRGIARIQSVVALLRPCFPRDDPYPFEWGHWHEQLERFDKEFVRFRSFEQDPIIDSCGVVLYWLFARHPAETAASVLPWLSDSRPFADTTGQVVMSDVASAFLYRFAPLAWDPICDGVFALFLTDGDTRLLPAILALRPDQAALTLNRWSLRPPERRQDAAIAMLARTLLDADSATGVVERLQEATDRLATRIEASDLAYGALVAVQARCPERREAAWNAIARLPLGWPAISPSLLPSYADERPTEVFQILERCLCGGPFKLRAASIEALKSIGVVGRHTDQVVAELRSVIEEESLAYEVGRAIEDLLYATARRGHDRQAVMELAKDCLIASQPRSRSSLIYYATAKHEKNESVADAAELLRLVLAHEQDSDILNHVLARVLESAASFAGALATLKPLRQRTAAGNFENDIIAALRISIGRRRRDYFTDWLKASDPAEGGLFRRLRADIGHGADPADAVEALGK